MTTSRRETLPHLHVRPNIEVVLSRADWSPPSTDAPVSLREQEPLEDCPGCNGCGNVANGEPCACLYRDPPQSTDTPGIRLDDLLELEYRKERTDGVWMLVHSQLSQSIPKHVTVQATYIIRRVSDRSLWAVRRGLPKDESDWVPDDELLALTRVDAIEVITTAYVVLGAQGTTGEVCAIEQPLTADLLEISSETVGD